MIATIYIYIYIKPSLSSPFNIKNISIDIYLFIHNIIAMLNKKRVYMPLKI